jgi:hypothetical protein
MFTPCAVPTQGIGDRCAKIPFDAEVVSWEYAEDLSEHNCQAIEHYLECRAVGWTDEEREDWLVRRHAALLKPIIDSYDRGGMLGRLASIVARAADRDV